MISPFLFFVSLCIVLYLSRFWYWGSTPNLLLEQLKQGWIFLISTLMSHAVSISQESQVHQRISELRKEGQWSASRLPKLVEASRPKSHWDYLLEEMQWMAADFAQERRWKEAAAKKVRQRWINSQAGKLHISTRSCCRKWYLIKSQTVSCVSATACSHVCPLPSRAEEKRGEVKERKGNSSSSHCQHNCQRGRILLVKHWAGMFIYLFIYFNSETMSWSIITVFTSLNEVFLLSGCGNQTPVWYLWEEAQSTQLTKSLSQRYVPWATTKNKTLVLIQS